MRRIPVPDSNKEKCFRRKRHICYKIVIPISGIMTKNAASSGKKIRATVLW